MNFGSFIEQYPSLTESRSFTLNQLERIRADLAKTLGNELSSELTIITTGSYGRCEASNESDIDLFCISKNKDAHDKNLPSTIETSIKQFVSKEAGSSGNFGSNIILEWDNLLSNIGGLSDDNKSMTRRVLFLLEGTWLYGEKTFSELRNELLVKYIKDTDSTTTVSRFFLNDVIRYYRTLTTDFEYKVSVDQKSWGLRNIKLKFSRKILYFGGIIAIAEAAQISKIEDRRAKILELLDKPVLERVFELWKTQNIDIDNIFKKYNEFMYEISKPEKRQELDTVTKEARHKSSLYIDLNSQSKAFSKDLISLINTKYSDIIDDLLF